MTFSDHSPAFLPLSMLERRDLLRVGAFSFAAGMLPRGVNAAQGIRPHTSTRADSVIFLWMGGGVTHIDSFDPKPDAPEEIRGTVRAIPTTLPGVQFGEPMPEEATWDAAWDRFLELKKVISLKSIYLNLMIG